MENRLKDAFRWHLQNMPKYRHGFGEGLADAPRAVFALAMARRDIAAGIARYPAPVKPWPAYGAASDKGMRCATHDEPQGLRFVGQVSPEFRRGPFGGRDSEGWLTDPHGDVFKDGTGLCYGVVYQLPGRNGESRFVAGYHFGGEDGGPVLDLRNVYVEPRGDWRADASDLDAARDAARAADSMAQGAAEQEREYQTAWRAGSVWADLGAGIESDRKELLAMLAERRAAKGSAAYPALCKALKREVSRLLAAIAEARSERAELAAGDYRDLFFWPGDQRLKEAFAEGAGLDRFPA